MSTKKDQALRKLIANHREELAEWETRKATLGSPTPDYIEEKISALTVRIDELRSQLSDENEMEPDTLEADSNVMAKNISGSNVTQTETLSTQIGVDKIRGDQYQVGSISGTDIFVGQSQQASINIASVSSQTALEPMFEPLIATLQDLPSSQKDVATQKAMALRAEVARGDDADDEVIAGLLQDLVSTAPDIIKTIRTVFHTPPAGIRIGPATRYVLKRMGI